MSFQCPECEYPPCITIKAWKRHMTTAHQGHTSDQLDDVMGNRSEGAAITGTGSLEEAIASMPVTEDEPVTINPDGSISPGESESAEDRKSRKDAEKEAKAARKRIQAKLDNFKSKISGDVPVQIFEYAGVKLEEKDASWLKESIELGLEVIGIQIEVTPYNIPIRNPLWILLYPFLVISVIVVKAVLGGAFNAEKQEKHE